jgi:hypothetical protein
MPTLPLDQSARARDSMTVTRSWASFAPRWSRHPVDRPVPRKSIIATAYPRGAKYPVRPSMLPCSSTGSGKIRVPSRSASVPWYGLASRITGSSRSSPYTAGSGRVIST